MTTNIDMLADSLGRPLRFILTGGHTHDIVAAPALLDGMDGDAVIADKAYDSNDLRQTIANAGMLAVIPSKRLRKVPIPHDPYPLQGPKPHRTLLQQAQALPTLRHPLRQARHPLSRLHPSRRCHDMDALNVDFQLSYYISKPPN